MSPVARRRGFGAVGAVLAGGGVAVAAWAAHGADGVAAARLAAAALHLSLHGLALVALDRGDGRGLLRLALWVLLAGTLLFSGTLLLAVAFALPTAMAPLGGLLTMAGWLLVAAALLRRG